MDFLPPELIGQARHVFARYADADSLVTIPSVLNILDALGVSMPEHEVREIVFSIAHATSRVVAARSAMTSPGDLQQSSGGTPNVPGPAGLVNAAPDGADVPSSAGVTGGVLTDGVSGRTPWRASSAPRHTSERQISAQPSGDVEALDFEGFVKLLCHTMSDCIGADEAAAAFDIMDGDRDGEIGTNDLVVALKRFSRDIASAEEHEGGHVERGTDAGGDNAGLARGASRLVGASWWSGRGDEGGPPTGLAEDAQLTLAEVEEALAEADCDGDGHVTLRDLLRVLDTT
eukprot:TRINITY_DN21294_c0_g1_i1.p1 TRINITY_DN21294_c0_g1~~TRINITY_DN21294_c0_g1_i1.p1  ORF type:complete len:288 (-),score=34.00 TRINITY_DN21294_c0_g1_i1:80-943(-)